MFILSSGSVTVTKTASGVAVSRSNAKSTTQESLKPLGNSSAVVIVSTSEEATDDENSKLHQVSSEGHYQL